MVPGLDSAHQSLQGRDPGVDPGVGTGVGAGVGAGVGTGVGTGVGPGILGWVQGSWGGVNPGVGPGEGPGVERGLYTRRVTYRCPISNMFLMSQFGSGHTHSEWCQIIPLPAARPSPPSVLCTVF